LKKDFKSFSDLGNGGLPVIDLGVELFIIRRTLVGTKSGSMLFNNLHDKISRPNEIELLLIGL